MDTLPSARALMGLSLVLHAPPSPLLPPSRSRPPLLLCLRGGLGLGRRDERYRELARAWAPVVGLPFAAGAVSGTVLSSGDGGGDGAPRPGHARVFPFAFPRTPDVPYHDVVRRARGRVGPS